MLFSLKKTTKGLDRKMNCSPKMLTLLSIFTFSLKKTIKGLDRKNILGQKLLKTNFNVLGYNL